MKAVWATIGACRQIWPEQMLARNLGAKFEAQKKGNA